MRLGLDLENVPVERTEAGCLTMCCGAGSEGHETSESRTGQSSAEQGPPGPPSPAAASLVLKPSLHTCELYRALIRATVKQAVVAPSSGRYGKQSRERARERIAVELL
jgi:hypothetical protein